MLNSICVLENRGISEYLCMAPGLHSTLFSMYCTSKGAYRNCASVYTNGIPICVRLLGVLENGSISECYKECRCSLEDHV